MSIFVNSPEGTINISNETIATIVGGAATQNFGIVGMASKNQVRDGIYEILKRENYSRGVIVNQTDNGYSVDLYIVVKYGVKISEVGRTVQENVSYNLQKYLGVKPEEVNVYVQSVRV